MYTIYEVVISAMCIFSTKFACKQFMMSDKIVQDVLSTKTNTVHCNWLQKVWPSIVLDQLSSVHLFISIIMHIIYSYQQINQCKKLSLPSQVEYTQLNDLQNQ